MSEKEKTNLSVVLEITSDIQRLSYPEYLRLLSHALVGLSESARNIDRIAEAVIWDSRANDISKLR